MTNIGFISKKKVAREIAKIYIEHNGVDHFDSGACSALNFLCTKLNIKPMHLNKLGGGTGEFCKIVKKGMGGGKK